MRPSINNTVQHLLLQIPICIASPGPQPTSDLGRATSLSSGHEVLLFPTDLRNTKREDLPVVLAWNGQVHYTPTVPMDAHEINLWHIRCMVQVAQFCSGVAEEVDVEELQDTGKEAVTNLIKSIDAAVAEFHVDEPSTYLTVAAAKQPSGIFPEGSTPASVCEAPEKAQSKKPGRKDTHCDECSMRFTRRSDYLSHYAYEHTDGSELKCIIEPCRKQLKSFKALKLHYKLQHDQDHKFICDGKTAKGERCLFRTHSQQNFDAHQTDKHDKGTKVQCLSCLKWFPGERNLARHKELYCENKKTAQCIHCPMAYTTEKKLMAHMKDHHAEELPIELVYHEIGLDDLLQKDTEFSADEEEEEKGEQQEDDEITLSGDEEQKKEDLPKKVQLICVICGAKHETHTEHNSHMAFHKRTKSENEFRKEQLREGIKGRRSPKTTLDAWLGSKKKDKQQEREKDADKEKEKEKQRVTEMQKKLEKKAQEEKIEKDVDKAKEKKAKKAKEEKKKDCKKEKDKDRKKKEKCDKKRKEDEDDRDKDEKKEEENKKTAVRRQKWDEYNKKLDKEEEEQRKLEEQRKIQEQDKEEQKQMDAQKKLQDKEKREKQEVEKKKERKRKWEEKDKQMKEEDAKKKKKGEGDSSGKSPKSK